MRTNLDLVGINTRKLVTVNQLVELLGGAVTESGLRAQVWAAQDHTLSNGREIRANGLASSIIRIGRKVLVDVPGYFDWLESHRLAPLADLETARDKAA